MPHRFKGERTLMRISIGESDLIEEGPWKGRPLYEALLGMLRERGLRLPTTTIAADDCRRTFETNVFGVIEVCRAFVPGMASAGYRRVATCRQVRDSSRRCLRMRPPTQCRRPRSTHSHGCLRRPIAAAKSSHTW